MITLPITWGDEKKQFTAMETPATNNVIFGRPLLNTFRAVMLTYHLVVKNILYRQGDHYQRKPILSLLFESCWQI